MELGARVEIREDSDYRWQRDQMGIGVIERIETGTIMGIHVRGESTGYSNVYGERDLRLVDSQPQAETTGQEEGRYPIFHKRQKVAILASTYRPTSETREFAEKKRQGIILERTRNRRQAPRYTVSVRRNAYWGGSYRERFTFNANDLVPWEKRNG